MAKEKITYSHFLTNGEFVRWRLYQTPESNEYWADYIKNNPDSVDALNQAITKFQSVRLNEKSLPQEKIDELLDRIIQSSAAKLKRKKRLKYLYWASAACLLILIASPFFTRLNEKIEPAISPNTIVGEALPPQNIQLISGTRTIDIKQNAEIQLTEKGDIAIIEEGDEHSEHTMLRVSQESTNKLIVPYGKRSTLTLSDGTRVWLNSGSELSFPSHFYGKERHITIAGEVFIDVAKDKEKPFYVHTAQLDVRVHGTKFNISSYHDSPEKSVVLVEGKVEVKAGSTTKVLSPGELFSWEAGRIRYGSVDVNEYTSWKDGVFIFKQSPISDILKKIGRYYNVNFSNNESKLLNRTCSGKLFLSDDIEQVMDIVSVISNTSYKKSGNNIYINNSE